MILLARAFGEQLVDLSQDGEGIGDVHAAARVGKPGLRGGSALAPQRGEIEPELLGRHFTRKHGPGATYGQAGQP